jgi:broad specificity phosphatase PhoE
MCFRFWAHFEKGHLVIYLVRHGETALNVKKVLQGPSNYPLTETGVRQAQEVADWFRDQGITFDRVYSSPLTRALQTARIIVGDDAEIVREERLIETDYGPYEGCSLSDPAPELRYFFQDFVNHPAPAGMEQLPEVVARVGGFLEEIRDEPGTILLSTHAIALKGGLEYLMPESKGQWWNTFVSNCCVFRIDRVDGAYATPVQVR